MIENLNSGGFQLNKRYLATDGTDCVLPSLLCLHHRGKVQEGGVQKISVSNFVENLRKLGQWPLSGFSVLVENPERKDTGWQLSLILLTNCS